MTPRRTCLPMDLQATEIKNQSHHFVQNLCQTLRGRGVGLPVISVMPKTNAVQTFVILLCLRDRVESTILSLHLGELYYTSLE